MIMLVLNKPLWLKWFLRISALVQIVYWGLSHLFFPQWYYQSIGGPGLAADQKYILLFMHEIGVLTLGFGIGTWLAAADPVKNFAIILMLYAVSLGSMAASLYHLLVLNLAQGEWATVVIIGAQVAILTWLYPWRTLLGKVDRKFA